MLDKKQQTINTYNTTAYNMAEKFDAFGARVDDIEETFKLISKENPFVLEIGCGSGRDAMEICKHTNNYLGIDITEKFLEIANKKVPKGKFEIADIENYIFPKNVDIIFAFASLIHSPKAIMKQIFKSIYAALNDNGVAYFSMKYKEDYQEITKEDEHGIRTYYFYSTKDIEDMATDFNIIKNKIRKVENQVWLEVLLQK